MPAIPHLGEIVKKCLYLAFAIGALLLTGCATPKTPEQYREAIRSYPIGTTVEKLNVDRSLSEVSKDLRERAPKCLNINVKSTFWNGNMYQTQLAKYHATVVENPKQTELYIQKNGDYIMVIDAAAVEKDKSEVTLYRSSFGYDLTASAVRGWATGENLGCPAITQ